MIEGRPVQVHGDGSTSRDFCYVANAVQANLLAACVDDKEAIDQVYNVAVGDRTTLNELLRLLRQTCRGCFRNSSQPSRSTARSERATSCTRKPTLPRRHASWGYLLWPTHRIGEGLTEAMPWYVRAALPSRPA